MKLRLIVAILLVYSAAILLADAKSISDQNVNLQWEDSDRDNLSIYRLADSYCKQLHLGGYNDWRLPKKLELTQLSKNKSLKKKFKYMVDDVYWSSSQDQKMRHHYLSVYLGNGYVSSTYTCDKIASICVREIK